MTAGRARLGAAAVVLALLAGCAQAGADRAESPPAAATTRPPGPAAGGVDAARGFRSTRGYKATPVPVRIDIPRIGVSAELQRLGQAADGTVEVPKGPHKWDAAGWYGDGTRPGDPGSAVILGHVDSKRGPAVFFRLRQLRKGDEIEVGRTDRSTVRFVVERVAQYDKQRFPTDEVYYPTLTPALRLVTCGGEFDPTVRHYRSNVIVFATLKP